MRKPHLEDQYRYCKGFNEFSTDVYAALFMPAVLLSCSPRGLMQNGSPDVLFYDRGSPCLSNVFFTVFVDVAEAKFYLDRSFDLSRVVVNIIMDKLIYFRADSVQNSECDMKMKSFTKGVDHIVAFFIHLSVLFTYLLV